MQKESIKKKKSKKEDVEFSTTIISTQAVVCLFVVALVLVSKIFLPTTFEEIKIRYTSEVAGEFDFDEIAKGTMAVLRPVEDVENIENTQYKISETDEKIQALKADYGVEQSQSIPQNLSLVKFDESELDIPQTAYVDDNSPLEVAFLNFNSNDEGLIENKDELELEEVITGASFTEFDVFQMGILPTTGRVSSPYGFRDDPFTGVQKFHGGIDIATPTGTPIAAAYDGKVIKAANYETGYGKHIIISHGDGMLTIYGHCNELLVEQGTVVRAGEIIACVGTTGNSTGPHLHFEVRVDGVKVNPLNLIDITPLD